MRKWIDFGIVFVFFGVGGSVAVGLWEPNSWVALGVLGIISSIVSLAFARAADLLGHPRSR